jgi:hypothetical protein
MKENQNFYHLATKLILTRIGFIEYYFFSDPTLMIGFTEYYFIGFIEYYSILIVY